MQWALVQGMLSPDEGRAFADALMSDDVNLARKRFSVMHTGEVDELIQLGPEEILDPELKVTRLTRLQRIRHMLGRIFWAWRKLPFAQRYRIGLTFDKVVTNLPETYRIANLFRGMPYRDWVRDVDTLNDVDLRQIRKHIERFHSKPLIRVVVLGDKGTEANSRTLESLTRQCYQHFVTDKKFEITYEGWWLFLHSGDVLPDHALYCFACAILDRPNAAFIYSDDDELDGWSRCRPRFKPDWSPTHLRGIDYIGSAVVINGESLRAAGVDHLVEEAGDISDVLLRLGAGAGAQVHHIPMILLHRSAERVAKMPVELKQVRYPSPESPPLVSIVVPTRDAVDVLQQCIESVLQKTSYMHYEILLMDNGTRDPEAVRYLERMSTHPRIRWLRDLRPFNYSELNNAAARRARGDVLCLLNNDTEVITGSWLEEMLYHLTQPNVGVVGAKLLYPDGRVQHAGDVVGAGGCANHFHALIGADESGYCHRALVAQEVSAVTGACMLTWRNLFLQVGGFEEKKLPVAFNDVDYCLKVRKAGHAVVWTPHAKLYHRESISRSQDKSRERIRQKKREVNYMHRTWLKRMRSDPFYNPNFSFARPDFVLGPVPRFKLPWK